MPLWPNLRGVLPPGKPRPRTRATHWPYASIKPLLLQAGELTPIEKAERRVLVLANPGHGLDNMQASAAMYLGMQLLLPGEWLAHTPYAQCSAYGGRRRGCSWSAVDGEQCPMLRGDLILTPTGLWHEHGHDGSEPVIWLDVLDLPLVYYLEASYHVNSERQRIVPGHGEKRHGVGGLLPTPVFERSSRPYPMLRYPWVDARAALESLAADQARSAGGADNLCEPADRRPCAEHPGFPCVDAAPGANFDASGAQPGDGLAPDRGRGHGAGRGAELRAARGRHLLRARIHAGRAARRVCVGACVPVPRRRDAAAPKTGVVRRATEQRNKRWPVDVVRSFWVRLGWPE